MGIELKDKKHWNLPTDGENFYNNSISYLSKKERWSQSDCGVGAIDIKFPECQGYWLADIESCPKPPQRHLAHAKRSLKFDPPKMSMSWGVAAMA